MIENIKTILEVLTLIGDVMLAAVILLWIAKKLGHKLSGMLLDRFVVWLKPRALLFGFFFALIATTGSLFYSDVAHFTPCVLCWYQRIMMYPQVILLGMAQAKRDVTMATYSLVLSGVGIVIAGIHYYEQITQNAVIPCDALGYSASCSQTFDTSFGYITIPMMAITSFGLIIMCMLALKKKA